jgi:hypothetical protein
VGRERYVVVAAGLISWVLAAYALLVIDRLH